MGNKEKAKQREGKGREGRMKHEDREIEKARKKERNKEGRSEGAKEETGSHLDQVI